MNKLEVLTLTFVREIREWLTTAELREIDQRNATEKYKGFCATQDFCDANTAMNDAWVKVFKESVDVNDDVHTAMWNAAWNAAKDLGFSSWTEPYVTIKNEQLAWYLAVRMAEGSRGVDESLRERAEHYLDGCRGTREMTRLEMLEEIRTYFHDDDKDESIAFIIQVFNKE